MLLLEQWGLPQGRAKFLIEELDPFLFTLKKLYDQ